MKQIKEAVAESAFQKKQEQKTTKIPLPIDHDDDEIEEVFVSEKEIKGVKPKDIQKQKESENKANIAKK